MKYQNRKKQRKEKHEINKTLENYQDT